MFAVLRKRKEDELKTLLAFFDLITERRGQCLVKKSTLLRRQINLDLIKRIFEKMDIHHLETEELITIEMSLATFSQKLDEFYPGALAPEDTATLDEPLPNEHRHESVEGVAAPQEARVEMNAVAAILGQAAHAYTGVLPLWADEAQGDILNQYIQASFDVLSPKGPDENAASFASRIRGHRIEKGRLEQLFKSTMARPVACDEFQEPMIFGLIKEQFKQPERHTKREKIQAIFSVFADRLHALPDIDLQQMYIKAMQVSDTLEVLRNNMAYFCERANLPADLIQLHVNPLRVMDSANPLQQIEFSLQAPNEGLGYSLHNILDIAQIIPSSLYRGNSEQRFDAPVTYILNFDQLKQFQRYLGDLSVWYRDLENILTALFASDASRYVKTGKKPLREAITTEVVRQRQGIECLMETSVRRRFEAHQDENFLLFGQAAIDLSLHPKRDEMRDLIQSIYTRCQLEDSKREAKTFVKDASGNLSYVSLLSVGHIRAIYDEIMALSSLTKAAEDMGLSIFDYIEMIGSGDAKGLYYQYLQLLLVDIISENSPHMIGENIVVKRGRIEASVVNQFSPPSRVESFKDLQGRFQKFLQNQFNKQMNIRCRPATFQSDLYPTAEEKHALLSSASYSIRSAKSCIDSDAVLDYSFAKLKSSPHYAVMATEYEQYFRSLGACSRIPEPRTYALDSIYLFPTLDACLDVLKAQFKRRLSGHYTGQNEIHYALDAWFNIVMKVVYADKMHISASALMRAATRFADTFKIDGGRDDLGAGCDIGLAGRCLNIDSQLVSGEQNLFSQFIRQIRIDAVEDAFNCTLGSSQYGESSMSARAKPEIMQRLGLQLNTTGRDASQTGNIPQFMQELATRYNPGIIFSKSYMYLCDEYKRCIRDEDHEGMSTLLSSIGYEVERDADILQIDGRWNIKRFESLLPSRLVSLLVSKGILEPGTGRLVIEADGTQYSFCEAIANKERLTSHRAFQPFFASTSGGGRTVNLQGESQISAAANTGSRG